MTGAAARPVARPFAHAHAAGADWRAVLKTCGDALAAQMPSGAPPPPLGLFYVTEPFAAHLGDIAATLKERLGVPLWCGAVGMGVLAEGREYYDTGALSVLLVEAPANSIAPFATVANKDRALAVALSDWAADHGPALALAHADPRNGEVDVLVQTLADGTTAVGFVVGGLTPAAEVPVQLCDTPTAGGLSGALIGAEVPVAVALSQGCAPIGPYRAVTAVQRAIIMELDGRPALEALKVDAGDLLTRDLRRVAGTIHVALPVEGSDTGAYTVRNLMGLDPRSGAIAVGADLEPGDRLMFVRRDPASARNDFAQRLAELKGRIAGRSVRGAHYVSCVARGRNLFGAENGEVAMIHDALGRFPLTGFFANGEICGNRLFGYTGVLTVFLDR